MIHLSVSAIAEIQRLKSKHPHSNLLRLELQPSCCASMSYQLNFDQATRPGDQVYSCGDIQVVVNNQNLKYLNGLALDYSEDLMGGGFRFHNPNAAQTCGCGNSFSIIEDSVSHPIGSHCLA